VSGESIEGGNAILLGQYVGDDPITIDWRGAGDVARKAQLPRLHQPGYADSSGRVYSQQDLDMSVLDQLAALMTFDSSSKEYQTILADFTDQPAVVSYVAKKKVNEFGSDVNKSDNTEAVIYDTDTDPVGREVRGTDGAGNPTTYITGSLYIRRLNQNCAFDSDTGACAIALGHPLKAYAIWQDPRSFVPAESQPLKDFRYSYTVSADGSVKIAAIGFDFDGH